MQACLTLTRRELGRYFVSRTGYVIMAAAVFLMGLSFVILLTKLQSESTPMTLTEMFFLTPFFWLILLLSAPVITMRLFAQEKYSGTFETLMTAPVSDLAVVAAKFAAAMIFHILMWLPLLGCILVLRRFSPDAAVLDPGALGATFTGIFLVGALYMAIGCFTSSLTKSQMVAAMTSFVIGLTLFLLSFLSESLPSASSRAVEIFNHISLVDHMKDFSRGIVDTRHVVFYATGTFFFLYLTCRVIESRRWK